MARKQKAKGPITIDWSYIDDYNDEEFTSNYRVPGRRGMGPASDYSATPDEAPQEEPSFLDNLSGGLPGTNPLDVVKFGAQAGQGLATPEGRQAVGEHVGGSYESKFGAFDFERLSSLEKYRTEEARQEAAKALRSRAFMGDTLAQLGLKEIEAAREIFSKPGLYESLLDKAKQSYTSGQERVSSAEQYYDQSGNTALRTLGDVASNAESGVSLLGGALMGPEGAVIGSAPMAKVAYDMAYTEARMSGITDEEARTFAAAMSGSEFVLEALGGLVGGKIASTKLRGAIKDQLAKRFNKFFPEVNRRAAEQAARIAGGAATGYAEEAGTEALQMGGAQAYRSLVETSPEFNEFLKKQAPRNPDGSVNMEAAVAQFNRAGLAGGAMGAGITGATTTLDRIVDTQTRTAEAILNNTVGNEEAKARYATAIQAAAKVSDAQLNNTDIEIPDTLKAVVPEAAAVASKEPQGQVTPISERPTAPKTAAVRGEEVASAQRKAKLGTLHKLKRDKGLSDEEYRAALTTATGKNSAKELTLQELDTAIEAVGKTAPAPVVEDTQEEEIAVEDIVSKIRGLKDEDNVKRSLESNTPPAKKGGLTTKQVIKSLVRAGKADTEAVVDLINNGKVGVVQSESELPNNVVKGRDGWYDERSKRVWLVADNLNKDTLRGTALHEINHFLNLNRKEGQPKVTGISNLIGENLGAYNSRIRALANSGNKIALKAVERADAAAENAPVASREFVRDQELTSYFASEALKPKGILGAAAGIVRDIKSAINTTARNKGIGELSDNDISYILRRQAEEAKNTEFKSKDTSPLDAESVIGERAANYGKTVEQFPERAYRGAIDNKKRIEISDRGAKLSEKFGGLKESGTYLGAMLEHPSLYSNYDKGMVVDVERLNGEGKKINVPQRYGALRAVTVKLDKSLRDGMAYDASNDTIHVSQKAVDAGASTFKSFLLHEMQHAIQAREGFVNGDSYDRLYNQEAQLLKEKLGVETLPREADMVARQRAWTKYDRTYGEAEARLSESNFKLTEEELSELPPEERFTERYIPDALNPSQMVNQRLPSSRTRLGSRPVSRVSDAREANIADEYLKNNGLDSVKSERGGNFDPSFVIHISGDLSSPRMQILEKPFARMLKNYLSKWAGLENDPLRQTRLTDGDLWGETIDEAIMPVSKAELLNVLKDNEHFSFINTWYKGIMNPNVPDDAPIWGGAIAVYTYADDAFFNPTHLDARVAARNIEDYLSHVKDYLLTVDPNKLQQYDLVRAVKETQKWDEEMKKKAEKARAKADAQLQTYIQFPDGYRWVRLTKPGQFAAESDIMGHSVRGYEPAKPITTVYDWYNSLSQQQFDLLKQEFNIWQEGVRDRGKIPVGHINTWAEKNPKYIAWKESVENSLGEDLALAGEGGHEAYGYGGWEAIKNDVARIYSLRDPSGKSVVTVELGKENGRWVPEGQEGDPNEKATKFTVSQIKGRFNEAPPEDTHVKTQDLLINLNEEGLIDQGLPIGDYKNAGLLLFQDIDGDVPYLPNTFEAALGKWVEEGEKGNPPKVRDVSLYKTPPTVRRVADSSSLDSIKLGEQGVGRFDEYLDTVSSVIKLGIDPNRGIGKWALETIEYWKLKSGGMRELAEGYVVRINNALKADKLSKEEFEKAVNKAESQKDKASRDRAFDALVRNFGEAGKEYRQGRELIDQMTRDLLTAFADEIDKTGRKPSQADLAVMKRMLDNIGQYTTRVYLLNIPATSKKWARGLIHSFDKGAKGDKYHDLVQKAIDYLIKHEVAIPDQARVLAHKGEPTIRRMYQTWIGPAENLTKDEMIYRLMAIRDKATPEAVEQMATRIVKDILVPNKQTTPTAKYYRGAAMDKTIITAREKVPAEIRALMGEITDPSQRLLVTLTAQAELLYRNRLLNDLYDNGKGTLWVSPAERADPKNSKFTEQLTGDALGPLNGMYATKEFAYNIKATRQILSSFTDAVALAGTDASLLGTTIGGALFRGAGKISGWQKVSKTVLDPGAWALNAAGSFLNLTKNGLVLGGPHSRDAIADSIAIALGGHKGNKEANKRIAVLLEHGLPDSVFTSELRDVEREFLEELLTELNKDVLAPVDKVLAKLKKRGRNARDIYGLQDAWVKIADFYGQQEYLTKYYKANGDKVSEEDINREAADIVKFRNVTYSRAPTLVRAAERTGATVFATYASEVVRTMVTTPLTVKMALQKAAAAKTAEAKRVAMGEAAKVTLGYAIAVGLVPYVTHAILAANFGEDEDERDRFLNLGFPEDKDQSYTFVGRTEDGKVVLFNASRIDPNGHITDFVRLAATQSEPEEYWKNFVALFSSPLGNGYGKDLYDLATRSGGKESQLSRTFPVVTEELANLFEAAGLERVDAQRTMRLVDNWWPGAGRWLDPQSGKVVEPTDEATQLTSTALRAMGIRQTIIDPNQAAVREGYLYNRARGDAVKKWNDLMSREGLGDGDLLRTMSRIREEEQAAQRRLAEVYSALDTSISGVNARRALKEAKVSPEDINDAALGRYRSVVLSASKIAEHEKKALKAATTNEERQLIRRNYREARRLINQLDMETR